MTAGRVASPSAPLVELLGRLGELKGLLDQAHARETASWEAELRDARFTKSEPAGSSALADESAWRLPNAPDSPGGCACAAVTVEDASAAGINRQTSKPATERLPSRDPPALQGPKAGAVAGLFPKSLRQMVQMQIELKKAGAFELRSTWDINDHEVEKLSRRATARQAGKTQPKMGIRTSRHLAVQAGGETEQSRCIVRPASGARLSWDIGACLLLSFDLVLVPLSVFNLGRNPFLVFMEWCSLIFWALDIGASFMTGIFVGRELELRAAKIARNYIRTWFCFDILVVGSELVMVILEAAATTTSLARTVRTARFLRVVRYLRIMRLLRLMRFAHVIEDLKERANHEFLLMAISISKLVGIISVLVHALACTWYFIGDVPQEQAGDPMGWVWVLDDDDHRLSDDSLGERYLYSFQFSLARLHPSNMSDNMELQTLRERFFSIFATMIAMLVLSILVSHLTNRMAEVKNMRAQLNQKSMLVRNYTQKHHISTPLIAQLKKYILTVYAAKIREGDEKKLMEILPQYLLQDLRHETFSPKIEKHWLFGTISMKHKRTNIDICFRALQEVHVYHGETLFTTGDVCTRMVFVVTRPLSYELGYVDVSGTVSGMLHPDEDSNMHDDECTVEPGDWISEAALWTAWENCGELRAMDSCVVVSVDADNFSETMKEHSIALVDVVPYARKFIQDLNNNKDDLTDLACVGASSRRNASAVLRKVGQ